MIHLHGTQAVAFRVLIVDGDPIQRDILARCVEMLGWTAETAACTDAAQGKYATRPHNSVIIDLELGGPDIERLLQRVRGDHLDPVVIFVTGAGDLTHAAARVARDLGLRVAGTLARPIDPYSLHALLLANPVRKRADLRNSGANPSARD